MSYTEYYEPMVQRLLGTKLKSVTLSVLTVIRLELTKGNRMSLEDEIRQVLFDLGKSIIIHKIDKDNSVIEIDYEAYVKKLSLLFIHQTETEDLP